MRLSRLSVQDFRNIAWAELHLEGRQQFLVGLNGQGKTNLLEAAGLATALRSFRTHDTRDLIRQGASQTSLAWTWAGPEGEETRVLAHLKAGSKKVSVDGESVYRLNEYIGRFPAVVFSSQDQQLIRGGPSLRRRWLDLLLSACHPAYYEALARYHRALEGRNQLLKQTDRPAEREAFEQPMAEAAAALVAYREEALFGLSEAVARAYAVIAPADDQAGLVPSGTPKARTAKEWLEVWREGLGRDLILRSTQAGPHRDDLLLTVQGRVAQDFGSEGQQRTLALALRLAEWEYLRKQLRRDPIVLADDVLSELDEPRRRRFWHAVSAAPQVIATGTQLPDADLGRWQVWRVEQGTFALENSL